MGGWPFAALGRLIGRIGVPPELRLQSERVVLRAATLDDFTAWSVLRRDNRDFLQPWEPRWPRDHLTFPSFRRRVFWARRQAQKRNAYAFMIELKHNGEIVGGVTLSNIRGRPARTGTLGYWIGERHARRGYTSEAVDRLIGFAFEELGLMRIEAACLPENAASRALLARCGFAYEGVARSYLEVDGHVRDHLLFARIRETAENGG